jgi:hypothetical protein
LAVTKYAAVNEITGSEEFYRLNPELRAKPKPADKTEARKILDKAQQEDFAWKFEYYWVRNNGPDLDREFQFDEDRKWRADYKVVDKMVLIELEGGVYSGGRHTRAQGFIEDCMKYNKAAMLGYTVYRIPTGCATDNYVGEIIKGIR